jgi:ABC-type transport system substrate-binding protein
MISNVSPLKKEFNSSLKPIAFDQKKASTLLSQAGWKDSDNDGILDKTINGNKIIFETELNYLNTSPDWRDMALLIAEELKKIGIKADPVPMELKLFLEKAKSHDFDMMLGSWSATSLPEDFTQLWHTSSWGSHGSNYTGFGNAASDSLIDMIRTEIKPDKRDELSRKLQQMITDDQPYVFLYTSMRRNILHKRFGNRMIFAERPGSLVNPLRLLSITPVITLQNGTTP